MVVAAGDDDDDRLTLTLAPSPAPLRRLELRRPPGGGGASPPPHLPAAVVAGLGCWALARVAARDGGCVPAALSAAAAAPRLLTLHLTHCSLTSLPDAVTQLNSLTELRVCHNKLAALPPNLGALTRLRRLHADSNQLATLPPSITALADLTELSLESNKLATPLTDVARFPCLCALRLANNPLAFLPDLAPASHLRCLTAAGARLSADAGWTTWHVELEPPPSDARAYLPGAASASSRSRAAVDSLWSTVFRRGAARHPLLAGALATLVERDADAAAAMAAAPGALQQLALALIACDDNDTVVDRLAAALATVAVSAWTGPAPSGVQAGGGGAPPPPPPPPLPDADAHLVPAAAALLASPRAAHRAAGGVLVAGLARAGGAVALASREDVRTALVAAVAGAPSAPCAAALDAVTALALADEAAASGLRGHAGLVATLERAASGGPLPGTQAAAYSRRARATRALAVLGAVSAVDRALATPADPYTTGIRVLALDGGGMKGLALVRWLDALEARLGPHAHVTDFFDLIVGTSTGAIVAAALTCRRMPLQDVRQMYVTMGARVFQSAAVVDGGGGGGVDAGGATSPPPPTHPTVAVTASAVAAASPRAAVVAASVTATTAGDTPPQPATGDGWRDTLSRAYASSTRSMRVAVYGSKHDASTFEAYLKQLAVFDSVGAPGDRLADIAATGAPRLAIVATLASVAPATPFVFRTYSHPPASSSLATTLAPRPGSAAPPVWAALRASSAAPYYLYDFRIGADRFQDGATTANNPAAIALQEARLLWPGAPLSLLVSIGCGAPPRRPRDRGGGVGAAMMDTGAVLIEAATSVRPPHDALASLAPLVPGFKYARFAPVDVRCAMDLDETDPGKWAALEAAADAAAAEPGAAATLDEVAAILTEGGVRCAQGVVRRGERAAAAEKEGETAGGGRAPPPPALTTPLPLSALLTPPARPVVAILTAAAPTPEHDAAFPAVAAARGAAVAAAGPSAAPVSLPPSVDGAAALAGALATAPPTAGVVVLALHADGGGGLATRVARSPIAFVLPSPDADAAAAAAGGTSLLALAAASPAGLRGGGGAALALTTATPVAIAFTRAAPAASALSLPPASGAGRVLVSVAPLADAVARSFVGAGAVAVIAPRVSRAVPPPSPDAAASFVSALVRGLRGGGVPVQAALNAAAAAAPDVAACVGVWWRSGGVVVAPRGLMMVSGGRLKVDEGVEKRN